MRISILFFVAFTLTACATQYQPKSFSGGFSETQLSDNAFSIEFNGNANTSNERASDFALLRSAEVTLEHGFKYFALADSKNSTDISTYQTPIKVDTSSFSNANGTLNMYGSTGYYGQSGFSNSTTTISGGEIYSIAKPSSHNLIICFNRKPKGQVFFFDANLIRNSLKKKYEIQ